MRAPVSGLVLALHLLAPSLAPSLAPELRGQAPPVMERQGRIFLEGSFSETVPLTPPTRTVDVVPGEIWEISLSSDDFDTLLRLAVPGRDTLENDDWGGTTDSRIRFTVPEGVTTITAIAQRYSPAQRGRYRLNFSRIGTGDRTPIQGKVGPESRVSPKGERYASHPIEVTAPHPLEVTLEERSGELGLFLMDPSGQVQQAQYVSDGIQEVSVPVPVRGTWSAQVVAPEWIDHIVDYGLTVTRLSGEAGSRREEGRLEVGDSVAVRGEYFDVFLHEHAGGPLRLQLISDDFDTYLAAVLPTGERRVNDDSEAIRGSEISLLDVPAGTVRVYVTSFSAGERGRYDLVISNR